MKKVTYGVTGLIDWNAKIPVGRAHLSVHFCGGALTKYGVTPAEFTTTNPMIQRIIEDSAYYRCGRITTLRSVGRPDVQPLSHRHGMESRQAFENARLPFDSPAPIEVPTAQVVEVDCIEDAIDHMRQQYNVPSVRIRTPESLHAIASQYGITFKIKDS